LYRSDRELIVTNEYVSDLDSSLKGSNDATISADTKVTLVDAALEYTDTTALYIIGNALADTLIASNNGDTLYGGGTKADTLVGGEGADKFVYKAGDGADVIVDYDPEKDQIYFLDTATTIASSTLNTKTGAVVFNITDQAGKNKSSITIQNAQYKPITFQNENGLITKQVFGNKNYEIQSTDVTTTATIDVTANTAVVTLDGSNINDPLYLIGNSANNLIIGGGGDDTLQGKTGKDTMTGGNGSNIFAFGSNDGTANWITDYGDHDTLMAISGAVTSVATIKNSSDMTATIGKTKVRIKDLKGNKLTVVDSLGSASSQVVGVNLIDVSNDDIITDGATLNTAINTNLITINAAAVTKDFAIVANAKNNYIVTGDSNETISTGAGKDTIEVSPVSGKTITIKDYTAGSDVLKLSNGTTIDNATIVAASGDIAEHVQLTIKNSSNTSNVDVFGTITTNKKNVKSYGKITVNDGDGNTFAQAFGGTAITVANGDGATIDATVNPTVANIYAGKRSKSVTIIGNSNNNSITGGTKGDTIIAGSTGDTLNGAAGNDMLISTISGSVTMIGGAGADTIQAHSSDNYITTGAGKDVIVISTGDTGTDIISDYAAGSDKISLDGTMSLSNASLDGTSVVLTFKDSGSTNKVLKLTNMRDKKITIVDKDGNFTSQPYAASTLTIVNSDGDTIDASTDANSDVTTINAKKRSKAVNIIGNVKDNSIIGGSKGDTLSGGSGGTNTLTGGKGNDFFVYEGGDVIITDYSVAKNNADEIVLADGLTLKNLSAVNNDYYYVDGKDVVFVVSDSSDTVGTINVKNGKDKAITFNGSASSYSKTYNDYTEKVFAKKDSTNTYTASSEDSRIKTINAKSKSTAVYIIGNNFADGTISTITGSAKIDTLQGGSGNDSLIGGKGADIFVFSDGSDTISDYVVGTDIVSITGTSVNATPTYEGNYLKVTTANNGTLYINNAKNKKGVEQKIKFMENGVVTSQVYGLSTVSIGANDGATISANTTINKAVTTLDANKRKTAVVLVGNSNNNTLIGGSGADSLYATSGDNSLVGGVGKDTMIGGSGKDTFYGGAGDDVVSLASSHDNSVINYNAGNDIVYSFGTGDVIKVADNQKIETATEVTAGTEYKLIVKNNKGKSVGTIDLKNSSSAFTLTEETGNPVIDNKKQIATTTKTWYVEVGGVKAAYKTEATTASTKADSFVEHDFEELIADDNFATTNDLDNILSTSADSTAITGEIINPIDSTSLTNVTASITKKKK
ncbi:MAG: hypothetical protein IJ728_10705, partial [Selenomonadaceae bacterium]|nr:hypothetical protein [Selenomonadaceae bacterium]